MYMRQFIIKDEKNDGNGDKWQNRPKVA